MNSALWVAKTGLDAQQTRMAVVSNNLANVNTTGFKRGRANFQDLLYQNVQTAGAQTSTQTQSPSGLSLGTGVRIGATEKLFTQGNMSLTNNSMDVAINGRGFFQVLQPDGTIAYTRDGSFQVDSQGQIVTDKGYAVQPGLQIPTGAQNMTISGDGIVSVTLSGQTTPQQIGTLTIADFINPAGLQARGENLYSETAASGSPQSGTPGLNGLGALVQGSLEASNVNVVEEMVNMIETQRAYEMNSKAISTTDQMLQFLTQNL
ncbi:MAG: flgG [Hydrocarboniphaga sp.]|uniref:flagellar basal-body rod protein FlgG n=1 Tax=Hydrocarboniphaga sp. TaxID=2033016 RepID=UPI0026037D54|nr:flagellar basal-body rod protein FlgG [Hydrocarboniphaga sp.]MDB5967591.1 flgG [Hydrocarboniphaga sp.]